MVWHVVFTMQQFWGGGVSCTDAVISFIPFSSRRKTQQFLHMQSKGSSFRPSARDGGLLDPMKTLKSPEPKPPVLREPPHPHPPSIPCLTLPAFLCHHHMPPPSPESLFDSTSSLKAPAVETLNRTDRDNHDYSRSTLT